MAVFQKKKNVRTTRNSIQSISVFAIHSAIYSIFKQLQQMQKRSLTVKKELKKINHKSVQLPST